MICLWTTGKRYFGSRIIALSGLIHISPISGKTFPETWKGLLKTQNPGFRQTHISLCNGFLIKDIKDLFQVNKTCSQPHSYPDLWPSPQTKEHYSWSHDHIAICFSLILNYLPNAWARTRSQDISGSNTDFERTLNFILKMSIRLLVGLFVCLFFCFGLLGCFVAVLVWLVWLFGPFSPIAYMRSWVKNTLTKLVVISPLS